MRTHGTRRQEYMYPLQKLLPESRTSSFARVVPDVRTAVTVHYMPEFCEACATAEMDV